MFVISNAFFNQVEIVQTDRGITAHWSWPLSMPSRPTKQALSDLR
jgi:hypothetical protein